MGKRLPLTVVTMCESSRVSTWVVSIASVVNYYICEGDLPVVGVQRWRQGRASFVDIRTQLVEHTYQRKRNGVLCDQQLSFVAIIEVREPLYPVYNQQYAGRYRRERERHQL